MLKKTDKRPKAVAMLSGGLDSALAAKIICDLGVEVHGMCCALPWGCSKKTQAARIAQQLGIPLAVMPVDEQYLEIIKNPNHGYGAALNPCVDCRIHMLGYAHRFMEKIGADFICTGEVLGQRPMSQLQQSMRLVEKRSGLQGRLVRPLCAQLLEPTIPETEGLIDRAKLLGISGRSRTEQNKMAQRFGITDYLAPGGGCLLTDKNFTRKIQDLFEYGYRDFNEAVVLQWGRHFRISPHSKIILGRDDRENNALEKHAHPDDYIVEFVDKPGPLALVKGHNVRARTIATAAGLVQYYSKYRTAQPPDTAYRPVRDPKDVCTVSSAPLTEEYIDTIKI